MGRERASSEDLAKLSEVVATWRAEEGGRGSTIPDELWNEAVRVARVDGVWRTAKATHFKYDALKQRLARADGGEGATVAHEIDSTKSARAGTGRGRRRGRAHPTQRRARKSSSSRDADRRRPDEFVELSATQLLGVSPTTGTVVEVEDRAGARMTVRLAKESPVDVAKLVAAFRRRGA